MDVGPWSADARRKTPVDRWEMVDFRHQKLEIRCQMLDAKRQTPDASSQSPGGTRTNHEWAKSF